ncbi:hypothetical protein DFJ73DRAFT_956428 [Zopfochytrium polystomum]|nr:hypothetical protein DFJ73DRAFT_956428 [Zopfochytrium polystomum]
MASSTSSFSAFSAVLSSSPSPSSSSSSSPSVSSGISSYYLGAADRLAGTFSRVKNAVLNVPEFQSKVNEATNNEPWGASSTLMTEIANATHNPQHFADIMEALYKRLHEKPGPSWRQPYKALQLLEYLIRNGADRVVDAARDRIDDLAALAGFKFTDEKGKDQGINVRQRAKEITDLLADADRTREERRKARENRAKYTGWSSDAAAAASGSSPSASGKGAAAVARDSYTSSSPVASRKIRIAFTPSTTAPGAAPAIAANPASPPTPPHPPAAQDNNLLLLDDADAADDWGDFASAAISAPAPPALQLQQQQPAFADFAAAFRAPPPTAAAAPPPPTSQQPQQPLQQATPPRQDPFADLVSLTASLPSASFASSTSSAPQRPPCLTAIAAANAATTTTTPNPQLPTVADFPAHNGVQPA